MPPQTVAQTANRIYMHGPRAAAGIGSACGPGASPTPDPRGCCARLQKRKRPRAGASCETQQQVRSGMRVVDSRKEPVQFLCPSTNGKPDIHVWVQCGLLTQEKSPCSSYASTNRIYMYGGSRAAAGIGSACGPGVSPTPDPRGCCARLQKRKRLRAGASCETQQQVCDPGCGFLTQEKSPCSSMPSPQLICMGPERQLA
jgi:hypothetical protein